MSDLSIYQAKREKLRQMYMETSDARSVSENAAGTVGVDHLAMISSDIERTMEFYTNVLGMRILNIIQNRDEPSSTHIFLDMGGGNMMAFFDFPKHGDAAVVRGIGAMHHVALKATPQQYKGVIAHLKARDHKHNIHGDEVRGSVYFHDPDNILLEVRSDDKERGTL
jgi:catechol 2,3-dioxygenase-like lactoylglutathione lyase family enzyme